MATFSENQVRQLYVAKAYNASPSTVGDLKAAGDTNNKAMYIQQLGAGGLVRAYSNSCSEALKKAQFGNVIAAKKVRIIINYEMIDKLNYILQDFKITYKEFSDKVSYEVLVPDDKLNLLESFPYEIINDCFITEEKNY